LKVIFSIYQEVLNEEEKLTIFHCGVSLPRAYKNPQNKHFVFLETAKDLSDIECI